MDKFAVISDVHSNRWALEAVMEDIRRQNIETIFNLGDVVYGPLDPAGTADILMGLKIPTVQGNEDRMILDKNAKLSPTLKYVRGQLNQNHLNWLRTLKPTLELADAFLFHGIPDSDTSYLLWEIKKEGAFLKSQRQVAEALFKVTAPIILCGHDHVPRIFQLADGKLVINPGSVGLQAYDDDLPYPHVMGTGSPHARYSTITKSSMGFNVRAHALPYNWQPAVDTALKNNRKDWALWLKTGQASV